MTTALAADVHDATYVTEPADRRQHLLQLAQDADRFSAYEIARALGAWADPESTYAQRAWRWRSLVSDVRLLAGLDGTQDRPAYDIAVGTLRADIDRTLDLLVGVPLEAPSGWQPGRFRDASDWNVSRGWST